MTKLREQMIQMMQREHYAAATIRNYVGVVAQFALYHRQCPSVLGDVQIAQYLDHLCAKGASASLMNITHSALRYFYSRVLDRPWNDRLFHRPRRKKPLPEVLSAEEVKAIISHTNNLKHYGLLMLLYSSGLRPGEVVKVKTRDIDAERMMLKVRQSKGKKDRYTILSPVCLQVLRRYWKAYRPQGGWLFEGAVPGSPYSIRSLQQLFHQACRRAGIHKAVTPHSFRHSFATHLLEEGVDTLTIKELLGHNNLQTTAVYLHVRQSRLVKLENPLDRIWA
jgi:site-specific recombinase XerD